MSKHERQRQQRLLAARKRDERQREHERMLARHAAHREAVSLWEAAWEAWIAAGEVGPKPIHPDRVGR